MHPFLIATLISFTGDAELRPGFHTRTVEHEGMKRNYLLHVPKKYDAKRETPLVLALHGATMSGPAMAYLSGFHETGDRHNFITIYPNGTGPAVLLQTWNAGAFPGGLVKKKIDDVGYLAKVLDDAATVLNVDKKRVFACGLSNGGMMCYRLASELSERIAAIAPVAGTLALEKVDAKRPVPVLHIHGTKDFLVPFEGPKTDGKTKLFLFMGVEDSLKPFVKLNECAEKGETSEIACKDDKLKIICRKHGSGKNGAEVVLICIEGGGHTWPGRDTNPAFLGATALDFNANEAIWEFFKKHPMK